MFNYIKVEQELIKLFPQENGLGSDIVWFSLVVIIVKLRPLSAGTVPSKKTVLKSASPNISNFYNSSKKSHSNALQSSFFIKILGKPRILGNQEAMSKAGKILCVASGHT